MGHAQPWDSQAHARKKETRFPFFIQTGLFMLLCFWPFLGSYGSSLADFGPSWFHVGPSSLPEGGKRGKNGSKKLAFFMIPPKTPPKDKFGTNFARFWGPFWKIFGAILGDFLKDFWHMLHHMKTRFWDQFWRILGAILEDF